MSILAPIVFTELNHLGRRFTCYICLILIWFLIILISRRHSYRKFKYFIYLTYAESDWAMSLTLRSLTQRCQRFHWVWLSSVIDTKESERFLKMQKTAGKCLSTLEPLHKNALSHEPRVQMSFNHEKNRETVWKLLWNCLFKIMKKLQESTDQGLYYLNQPGNGERPPFINDPQIILQKWGTLSQR